MPMTDSDDNVEPDLADNPVFVGSNPSQALREFLFTLKAVDLQSSDLPIGFASDSSTGE
jgi:hypothetical protein